MSATTLRPEVRTALHQLIDYAGLFPPARLEMQPALEEYAAARSGGTAWMLGRFILALSRFEEAAATPPIAGSAARLPVSAIVDAEPDPRRWFESVSQKLAAISALRRGGGALEVGALEVPLPAPASARDTYDAPISQLGALLDREGLRALPVYVETPRDSHERAAGESDRQTGALRALARARMHAKVRCGGLSPEAFPSPAQLARFVAAACDMGVAFKATAGLHHPVRHFDPQRGVRMHGFLNLLAAAAFAGRIDAAHLQAIVEEEDPQAFSIDPSGFAWRTHRLPLEDLAAARERRFTGYGSCSFSEPVEDLRALGWLCADESIAR